MYARFAEIVVKAGKSDDFLKTMREHVLPMLKTAPGFVDLMVKEDAERYTHEQLPLIREMAQPLVESRSDVRSFDVCVSILHELQCV